MTQAAPRLLAAATGLLVASLDLVIVVGGASATRWLYNTGEYADRFLAAYLWLAVLGVLGGTALLLFTASFIKARQVVLRPLRKLAVFQAAFLLIAILLTSTLTGEGWTS